MGRKCKNKNKAKYFIHTHTYGNKHIWYSICINGCETIYSINKNTLEIRNNLTELLVPFHENKKGYTSVYLKHPLTGKNVRLPYHRIIAAIFIPIPQKYQDEDWYQQELMPNHKDGNPRHNTIDNLEWTTQQDNTIHAFKTGLADVSTGERSHLSTVTDAQIRAVCYLLSVGFKPREVALKTRVKQRIVQHVKDRECWTNISDAYVFPKDPNMATPFSKDTKTIRKICRAIEKAYAEGVIKDKEIGAKYGVSREYVRDIRNHKRRNDISKDYKF